MKTKQLLRNMSAAIAALFIAAFSPPQKAQAKVYNLWIANVQVTDANCSNLSIIPGVDGIVSYNPATKTLTLNNAYIDAGDKRGIISEIDGFIIQLKGVISYVFSNLYGAVCLYGNSFIKSDGNALLSIKSKGGGLQFDFGGIDLYENKSLTISNCTVESSGFYGISGNGADLIIDRANVYLHGEAETFFGDKKA